MLEHDYINQEEYDKLQQTSDNVIPYGGEHLISELKLIKVSAVPFNISIKEALKKMDDFSVQCLPVLDAENELVGMIDDRHVANYLADHKRNYEKSIEKIYSQDFKKLDINGYIKHLQKAFSRYRNIIIKGEADEYFICEQKSLVDHFMKNYS